MLDIEHFIEELPDVEAEPGTVFVRDGGRVFAGEDPALRRGGELEFVPVVERLGRGEGRTDFGDGKVPDPDELVLYLLPFGFELHRVGENLPFAASAYPEVRAVGCLTVRGRGDQAGDPAFHVVFLFAENVDVDDVARYGQRNEDDDPVHMGEGVAFRRYRLDRHILQQYVYFPSCHIMQR